MFLRKFLFVYFHVTSVLLGIFNFVYDCELSAVKEKWILNLYGKIISTVMLSTGPFYAYCMYYYFSRQNFTQMLLIMWSLEYMTLFLMSCVLFYTVNVNQKSILQLINEGMKILSVSRRSGRSLAILFIKLFAIDHIALILQISSCFLIGFGELEAKILGALCYTMNFVSFFTTNAFAFILVLIRLEFKAINANIASDILRDNHLRFLESLRAHRRLRSFCHRVIGIFSKICIANMLYAFSTTISSVCSIPWIFNFDIIIEKHFLSLFFIRQSLYTPCLIIWWVLLDIFIASAISFTFCAHSAKYLLQFIVPRNLRALMTQQSESFESLQ